MKHSRAILVPGLALLAVVLARPPLARAGSITETVTVNTTSFVGSTNPFEVFFSLTDGSGSGDGNNTVTLSGFSFGSGGSAGAVDTGNTSNAAGDLASGVTMNDANFSDSFAAFFTPGSSLSFTIADAFTSLDSPTPDMLSFALVDNGALLTTNDPSLNDNLLTLTLDSASGTTAVYTDQNASDSVGTPTVGSPVSAPEPHAWMLLIAGLGLLGIASRSRLRRAS
jgi:hypothetical protein